MIMASSCLFKQLELKEVLILNINFLEINIMKKIKNWDNKTWLSSKTYISEFIKFLKTELI